MIASFFASIGSWILGLIGIAIVCVVALPIGMVGYALNQGITQHSQIDKEMKKLKSSGQLIDMNKVKSAREQANNNLKAGYIGLGIMAAIYVLILIFIPKFFVPSLLGLIPLGLGLFGAFLVPDVLP